MADTSPQRGANGASLIGQTLGGYEVLSEIGTGGMGVVYKARHTRLHRLVALKLLRPEQDAHEDRRRRFLQEARAASALDHAGIVTIHDVFTHDGGDVIVMELVDGEPLDRRIPAGGLPWREVASLAIELAEAVAVAHEGRIIHRDLKPSNVMVTVGRRSSASSRAASGDGMSGRVKILDFGIAKLMPNAISGDRDADPTLSQLTRLGVQPGTPSYMAPEQLLGEAVDPRTDVFAFGILVYEMLTGQRPFHGATPAALADEILHADPTSIRELRPEVPENLAALVEQSLMKHPAKRYQSMDEISAELRALLAEPPAPPPLEASQKPESAGNLMASTLLEEAPKTGTRSRSEMPRADSGVAKPSTGATSETEVAVGRWRRWVWAGVCVAMLIAVIALGLLGWWSQESGHDPAEPAPVPASAPAKPTMAVFQFRNLTKDPQLDWLSSGIAEMLITDLSQSSEIEVLSTSRLYRISKQLEVLEDAVPSFERLQAVGEESGIEMAVRGGYARVGERLRISLTLEAVASGSILESDNVDGYGQDSLFSLIDELSVTLRRRFEVKAPVEMPRTVQAITTSSVEAWRLYTEANALSFQSKRTEAITLLEKAVDLDPDFALALVNLGSLHQNLGHGTESRQYMQRAVELADHLPLDVRYQIQGVHFSNQWATYDQAIESFQEILELYPDRAASRVRLARLYAYREQYEPASRELRGLIENGTTHPGTYLVAANVDAARGNFETGHRLLSDFAVRYPDNWLTQAGLAWHLTDWGRLEEATAAYQRAEDLRPGEITLHNGRWRLRVLQEDWQQADFEAKALLSFQDSFGRWRGAISQARNLLYQGKADQALAWFDQASSAYPNPEGFTAVAHAWKAELLLQLGKLDLALREAERAQVQAPGSWPEWQGIFFAALAQQALGQVEAASRSQETLFRRNSTQPNPVQERQLHHLAGLLAQIEGDNEAALESLTQAEALMPSRGIEFHWYLYPQHVPIWYALGQSALATGDSEAAQRWFERVAASGSEHLEEPVPYVRSFFWLGRIHQERGEQEETRRYFERFLAFWIDGDLDRSHVELALAATRS